MAEATGEEMALVLLRVIPSEVAELLLTKIEEQAANRLREKLRQAPPESPNEEVVDAALTEFFDLQRIAARMEPETPSEPAVEKLDPLVEIRSIPPERLVRAIEGEQPGAIALVLSCLDPTAAGHVMKRLLPDLRIDVTLRISKLGPRNPALLAQLARTVCDKARRLAEIPPEPTKDELVNNLADMIRALPRSERMPIITKIQEVDPVLASLVLEKLYRIEDLLRIPDRQLQVMLAELDVKTIATALKTTPTAVRTKVTSNMSSRARAVLEEESEMLGEVPQTKIKDAQRTVLALIRKGEEEGSITIEE